MRARRSRSGAAATLLAALLAWEPGAACPGEPPPSAGAADPGHEAFVRRVNAAIDKGRDYLLGAQRNDGTWFLRPSIPGRVNVDPNAYGEQALVLLALAKAGVEPLHPQMKKGLQVLRAQMSTARGITYNGEPPGGFHTYSASCVVQLLDALFVEHPVRGAQGRGGAPAKPKIRMAADEKELLREIASWFARTQREWLWRYPGPTPTDEDLSATQYALLALETAGRLGVHVHPEIYRRALTRLLAWQQAEGPETPVWVENPAWDASDRYPRWQKLGSARARGWPYQGGGTVTGSMTCAGISSLAIVKDRLKSEHLTPAQALTREEESRLDKALIDGLGWMSANFEVKKNPGAGAWHYYYLYGMERACSLLGVERLGQHDWYREGADYLVAQQQADGSWPAKEGGHDGRVDVQSAFALLFLKRATVPTRFRAPVITGGGSEELPPDGR